MDDLVTKYQNIINHLIGRYEVYELEDMVQKKLFFELPEGLGAIERLAWEQQLTSLREKITELKILASEKEELERRFLNVLEEAIRKLEQTPVPTVNGGSGSSGAKHEKPIPGGVERSDVSLSPTIRREQVIVLIHGIRTFANWQPMVARVLEETPSTVVVPLKYGFLNSILFWCPLFTRGFAIEQVRREIQNVQVTYTDADLSVIAHSFGTYAIIEILKGHPNIVLKRLVLCGSIVKQKFRWEQIRPQLGSPVVNDYGTRDIWPVLAKCLSWGYGDTGRHAFGRVAVRDRAHDYKHSGFFNEEFVRQYWKPWFERGEFVPSEWGEQAPTSPYWLSLLSILPLQWLIVFGLGALILWYIYSCSARYEGTFADYLATRDTFAQKGDAGIDEFNKKYIPVQVKWDGYVVWGKVENGYFISAQKTGEANAIVKFKSGEFKSSISEGTHISFEGCVRQQFSNGRFSIEEGGNLNVLR